MHKFIFTVTTLVALAIVASSQNTSLSSLLHFPYATAQVGKTESALSLSLPISCSPNPTTGNEDLDCSNGLGWSCPPGLFCDDERDACRCGAYPHDIIICVDSAPWVLNCNCVTFDCARNLTLVGNCLHTCGNRVNTSSGHAFYSPLPLSFRGTSKVCRDMNRTGALCGRCKSGYYPLAYSFDMNCVQCPNARWNWLWYVMAAYLPLTLFYFVVLLLQVNVSSSYLHAIVTHCQVISLPVMLRVILKDIAVNTNRSYVTGAKVLFSIFGIWNLDFFRPFYSNLCLGIGILPTLALDYLIAVYPLFLVVVSYILIKLYDSKVRVVVVLWRPFKMLSLGFRRNWNVRTSVIDAYSTFFLLSNTKFLSVSFDLLVPTKVYKLYGTEYHYFLGLYYAQDIKYFSGEHFPYAALAIAVLAVFFFLPVFILLVYPFRVFRRLLSVFPFRHWYVLHTFVDSYQGCYKNGTEPGTRDYRWFSAVHFLVRVFLLAVYAVTLNVVFYVLGAVTLIAFSMFIVVFQPYRSAVGHNNVIHTSFILLLAVLFVLAASLDLSAIYMVHLVPFFHVVCFAIASMSLLCAVVLVACRSFKMRRFSLQAVLSRIRRWKHRGYEELDGSRGEEAERREGGREGGREEGLEDGVERFGVE